MLKLKVYKMKKDKFGAYRKHGKCSVIDLTSKASVLSESMIESVAEYFKSNIIDADSYDDAISCYSVWLDNGNAYAVQPDSVELKIEKIRQVLNLTRSFKLSSIDEVMNELYGKNRKLYNKFFKALNK